MPWKTIETESGPLTFHACTRGGTRYCTFCRNLPVAKLCDYATGKNKTCDAGMCEKCATSVGPDLDYCPRHKQQAPPPQQHLFGDAA
jgi:hypothetical protein